VHQQDALSRGIHCVLAICSPPRSIPMLDIILLATGLAFFVVSVGYAYACDRL